MTLTNRFLLTGAVAAIPLAYIVTSTVSGIRTADATAMLDHVVRLQLNDQVRERCESDAQWFLMGSLEGRLKPGAPKPPDEARAWERGVDELAEQDAEVAEYVRALEEAKDATDLPEASGDAIAREFERYLRRRDGGQRG